MAKIVEKKEKRRGRFSPAMSRRIRIFLIEIAAVFILSAIVSRMFFGSVSIQENSMSPTIESGDTVLLNRVSYSFGSVQRGDLIAYRLNSRTDSAAHVKRVIGLPGETIQISEGTILINGSTYLESEDYPEIMNAGLASDAITLGNDEYFVLGDNRNNSEDSRYTDVGNISREDIIGKVWFRTDPRSSMGLLR
ncbi:MAG: signal peptidase I [Lachnospiraceae bacterium]|nr:signal peptidase I [Lachnospiraceae bacterium]